MASVTRLDLARDFTGSSDPSSLILGLSRVPRSRQRDPHLRTNSGTGELQSLRVGARENSVRLYRKDLESGGLTPEGSLRWECQVASRPLERYGVASFADITDDCATRIAEDRWAWSRMGTPVRTVNDLYSFLGWLDGSLTMTARLYWDLKGYAEYGTLPFTDYGRRKLAEFIRDHGAVVAARDFTTQTIERLRWDTGRVAAEMALADVPASPMGLADPIASHGTPGG